MNFQVGELARITDHKTPGTKSGKIPGYVVRIEQDDGLSVKCIVVVTGDRITGLSKTRLEKI